jgi:hypothetical protein
VNPQGSATLNVAALTSLQSRIERAGSCAELAALVTEHFASLSAVKAAIAAESAAIAPILALLEAPTNPAALITWVENFITGFLTPYVKPYVTLAQQLVQLEAQVVTLTAAIEARAAQFESCVVGIPAL